MVAKGFTLIELIIVVAIIAILVTVAMPAYQDYVVRTVNQSCLWEVKGYTNAVFLALNDEDTRSSPPTVVVSACHNITDASSWIEGDGNHIIIAFSKSPANKRIECDIYEGATCRFIP